MAVHKAIANEYENCAVKFELDVQRIIGCVVGIFRRALLENAALKALDMGAFKEAVNSLSQAIA